MWKMLKFCIYSFLVVGIGGVIGGGVAPHKNTVLAIPSTEISIEDVKIAMLDHVLDVNQNDVIVPMIAPVVEQIIIPETIETTSSPVKKQESKRGPPMDTTINIAYVAINVPIEIEEITIELAPITIWGEYPQHLRVKAQLARLEITKTGIVAHVEFVNSPTRGASDVFDTESETLNVDNPILANMGSNIEPGQPSVEIIASL